MIGLLGMRGVKAFAGAAASALLLVCMGPVPVLADTIEAALVRAYQNNPQLNAQRSQVRVTDENVPQALSGYRPKVNVTLGSGYQYQDVQATQNVVPPTPKSISGLLTCRKLRGLPSAILRASCEDITS